MGRVISTDTQEGASTPELTETGQGGLFSTGYLRDDPAGAYVGDGESVAFVVTNAEKGVARERDEDRTTITPGDGFRTICVVTDRRVIVLVGDGDGDERITLPLIEVADARADDGDMVVEMDAGEIWRIHAGDGDVEDVAAYVADAARTWDELERELDAIKRELVCATAARDEGEYERGIDSAQTAYDRLDDAAGLVDDLAESGPAGAMEERVDRVRDRCVQTVADVRLGHGRALADEAEELWRAEQWEAAFDGYERARAEFEAVDSLDASRHEERAALERGLQRVEQATERLAETPLQRAIDADRRANDAEDPDEAVADWRTAWEWYHTALSLDADEPERRFAGDPEKIEDRVETVTDRVVETALDEGTEAKAAGTWYLEADRPRVAHEELVVAESIFEDVVAVAREARPEAVDELEEWLGDVRETLQEATEALEEGASVAEGDATDGEDGKSTEVEADEDREADGDDFVEGSEDVDAADVENVADVSDAGQESESDGSREEFEIVEFDEEWVSATDVAMADDETREDSTADDATVGIDDRPAEAQLDAVADADRVAEGSAAPADGEGVIGDGAAVRAGDSGSGAPIPIQLRALDPEGFDALARELVESMGWTPEDAPADAPFDLLATRSEPEGTVAVRTIHRPMAGPVDADQVEDATDLHDEVPAGGEVMIVTSSGVTEAAVRAARHQSVRLIDEDYITTVLASRETDDLLERIRPRPSD